MLKNLVLPFPQPPLGKTPRRVTLTESRHVVIPNVRLCAPVRAQGLR